MKRGFEQMLNRCLAMLLSITLLLGGVPFELIAEAQEAVESIEILDIDVSELNVGNVINLQYKTEGMDGSENISWSIEGTDADVVNWIDPTEGKLEIQKKGSFTIKAEAAYNGETYHHEKTFTVKKGKESNMSISVSPESPDDGLVALSKPVIVIAAESGVTGVVSLNINGVDKGDISLVNSVAEYVWSDFSRQDYEIKAEYEENQIFEASSDSFIIDENDINKAIYPPIEGINPSYNLTYGEALEIDTSVETLQDCKIEYADLASQEILDISWDGTKAIIQGKKAGTGKILICQPEDHLHHGGDTKEVTFTIEKEKLYINKINMESKIYDGTSEGSFSFDIEESQISSLDLARINEIKEAIVFDVGFANSKVGKKTGAADFAFTGPKFGSNSEWGEKYTLDFTAGVKDSVKTTDGETTEIFFYEIPILIENKNEEIPYSTFDWSTYKQKVSVLMGLSKEQINSLPAGDVDVLQNQVKLLSVTTPDENTRIGVGDHDLFINNTSFVLEGSTYKKQVNQNYQYVYDVSYKGSIKIVQQKINGDDIMLDTASANVVENLSGYYARKEGFCLKMKPVNTENYDKAYTKIGNTEYNLSDTGLMGSDMGISTSDKNFTIDVYLKKNGCNQSVTTPVVVNLDADAPLVSLKLEESNDELIKGSSIKFGVFDNQILTADIDVNDSESGYEEWQYYIHKSGSDMNAGEVVSLINSLSQEKWKHISADATPHKFHIEVPGKEDAGNYVVFVKVQDRVGNAKLYTSTGMIIDMQIPSEPTILLSGESSGFAYSNDVTAEVKAFDIIEQIDDSLDKVVSGIKSVKYEIRMDGKTFKVDGDGNKTETLELEELWSASENSGGFSLLELQIQGEICKIIKLKASDFESNHIELCVVVEDRAGNKNEKTVALKIDKTRPQVEIAYTDTVKEPQNDIYFNKCRTAVITVTEANFDPDKVKFKFKREGEAEGTYTLQELNAKLGTTSSWESSQTGGEESYTNQRTNTAVILFNKDDSYEFEVVKCEDKAGNAFWTNDVSYLNKGPSFTKANKRFVIDTKAPVITLSYSTQGKNFKVYQDIEKRVYKNKEVTANITINEKNFALSGQKVNGKTDLSVSKVNPENGQKLPNAKQYTEVLEDGRWEESGDSKKIALKFDVDANYGLKLTYTDLAGNTAVYEMAYFTVDKTRPVGKIKVGELGTWEKWLSKITFGLFSNKKQKIKINGSDVTSPIKGIYYYQSKKPLSRGQMDYVKWEKGSEYYKKPEEEFIIYAKIEDEAGNIQYLSSNGIILDKTKADLGIKITAEKPEKGIYNQDVPVNITVKDPRSGGTFAGIKSVSYEVLSEDQVTQKGSFNTTLKPASKRVKSISRNIVIDAAKNNSNFVSVNVSVLDNAGNTSSSVKQLKIDITNPVISVSYSNGEATNDTYYHDTRTSTVTITERNFDPDNVQFDIKNSDGTQPSISSWSSSEDAGFSDSATHTCTVTFAGDGDYSFGLKCTDLAGNSAEYGKTDSFTIDKTIPEIEVIYDNNEVQNGRYYNKKRQATVKITEHNFNAGNVKTTIEASLDGENVEAPAISGFSSSGNVHTATIEYEKDADYRFSISYSDMAGNTAKDYEQDYFTIDTIKPTVKMSGFSKANKDTVIPNIMCDDVNYSAEGVNLHLSGSKNSLLEVNYDIGETKKSFTINNFKLDKSRVMDDVYTLTVKATDLAGNVQEKTEVFSINRYGSVYTMGSSISKLLKSYYTNSPEDLTLTETNVDTLNFVKITCSKDGKQMTLEEGNHYEVDQNKDKSDWKVYNYTIKKENFQEDGKYVVTVYSEDSAKNTSSNQEKSKSIEFVVDRTSPTIVVTGVENKQQYRANSQVVTIDAKDNIYLKSLKMEVIIDGEDPTVYEFADKELSENYGVMSEIIMQANKWQTLKVSAEDMAGNIYKGDDIRILVTPNFWVQFYMNKPLLGGTALLIIFSGIGIVMLIKKKRGAASKG